MPESVFVDTKEKIQKYETNAFQNVEYKIRMTYTIDTDRRIMTFFDALWGFEVSGGVDQFEPLTIVSVTETGLAKRAGMRIGDEITQINDTLALELTFNEALQIFRQTKRFVKVYVRGDAVDDGDGDDFITDLWFKPRKPWKRDFTPIVWEFPWNDRRKPVYRESNCFMVPSKMEEKIRARRAATSAVKKKEEDLPHTRSLTPSPRPKNQPGPNLLDTILKPRGDKLTPDN